MKSITLLTAFGLLAGSAYAGETAFVTASGGQVKASINILVDESNQDIAPGASLQAAMIIDNRSADAVEMLIPSVALRYSANGTPTQINIGHTFVRRTFQAGESYNELLQVSLPADAQVGTRLKIGMVVGLSSNEDDLRQVFAVAPIVRGITTSNGFYVATYFGAGGGGGPLRLGHSNSPTPRPQPRLRLDTSDGFSLGTVLDDGASDVPTMHNGPAAGPRRTPQDRGLDETRRRRR